GEPPDEPLEFEPTMNVSDGYGQSIVRYVRLAIAEFERAGSVLRSPLAMTQFEEFIDTSLLLSHPHNYAAKLVDLDRRSLRSRDVKRAVDYMQTNLHEPITLADITQASGVPGRTLFKHFQDCMGMSPMRYLRNARLAKVREALRQAS